MNIDPSRFYKLRFEGASHKAIARKSNKKSHTIKAWLYGKHGRKPHDTTNI